MLRSAGPYATLRATFMLSRKPAGNDGAYSAEVPGISFFAPISLSFARTSAGMLLVSLGVTSMLTGGISIGGGTAGAAAAVAGGGVEAVLVVVLVAALSSFPEHAASKAAIVNALAMRWQCLMSVPLFVMPKA
jgi:hypothetical protein